ncbi:MAG: hypothetical protein KDA61_16535 [Planctomycetales bacterium]|nr:hypothetical protein [Planctomycetales bacterium]
MKLDVPPSLGAQSCQMTTIKMGHSSRQLLGFLALVSLRSISLAGQVEPSWPYCISAADCKHVLVVLGPDPIARSQLLSAELPNGTSVDLPDTIAESGLYERGSDKPVWTIDWCEGFCYLSSSGDYLVRLRDFGETDHPSDKNAGWAIQFYANGTLVKEYGVSQIIDYPSLIPGWYHGFVSNGYSDMEPGIADGIFSLNTCTHERYRFSVSTGAIVSEFHLWKTLTYVGVGAILVLLALSSIAFVHWSRGNRQVAPAIPQEPPEKSSAEVFARYFSFRVRSAWLLTAIAAFLCHTLIVAPHIGVFLIALACAIATSTARWRFSRIFGNRTPIAAFQTAVSHSLLTAMIACWFLVYAISIAPAMALLGWLDSPYDVCMVVARVPYAPVYWILTASGMEKSDVVEWYFSVWRT